MVIEQSLEELLEFFGSVIEFTTDSYFIVRSNVELPKSIGTLSRSIRYSQSSQPINVLGSYVVAEYTPGNSYSYEFLQSSMSTLKILLYTESEQIRYKEFSKLFIEEVESTLKD